MEEPSLPPGFHLFRCWRGPSLGQHGMAAGPADARAGYDDDAERIVARSLAAVERHGFREYYNPLTGRGLARARFGWSTLLVDL